MMTMASMKKNRRGHRGQGMTEYIIIVALIAIAAIGVVTLFGDNIRALFATSGNALAGNENATADTSEAKVETYGHKNLKTFGLNNGKTKI